MNNIILLFLSALPVVVIGIYIYKKDKEKEPIKLLLSLFLRGVLSVVLVIILSGLLEKLVPFFAVDEAKLNLIELAISVFIGIALIEEFCKWRVVYKFSYNHHENDESFDIIIYAVFVSLGFAFLENIFYVFSSGITTGIIRALLAVPGHACDGVFMGYYLSLAKRCDLNNDLNEKKKNVFLSLLVPVVLHGIYDFCIFAQMPWFLLLFIVFVIWLYVKTIKKIRNASKNNYKMSNKGDMNNETN